MCTRWVQRWGTSTSVLAGLVLGLALASPALADPAFVQIGTNSIAGSGTVITVTLPTVMSGDLLIAGITFTDISNTKIVSTVTDDTGGTWVGFRVCGGGATPRVEVWYAANHPAAAGTTTLTITLNLADVNRVVFFAEYSGISASAQDQSACNVQTTPGTATDAVTSTAQTTTVNNELIVGVQANINFGATNHGTNFVERQNSGTHTSIEDRLLATAGSVAATFTNVSASDSNTTVMTTFKPLTTTCRGANLLLGVGC